MLAFADDSKVVDHVEKSEMHCRVITSVREQLICSNEFEFAKRTAVYFDGT